jgi:hypothetical protein
VGWLYCQFIALESRPSLPQPRGLMQSTHDDFSATLFLPKGAVLRSSPGKNIWNSVGLWWRLSVTLLPLYCFGVEAFTATTTWSDAKYSHEFFVICDLMNESFVPPSSRWRNIVIIGLWTNILRTEPCRRKLCTKCDDDDVVLMTFKNRVSSWGCSAT